MYSLGANHKRRMRDATTETGNTTYIEKIH
jgi:hypothetical protein